MNAKLLGLFLALVLLASMYTESEAFAAGRIGRKRSSIQVSRETSWNTSYFSSGIFGWEGGGVYLILPLFFWGGEDFIRDRAYIRIKEF